MSTSKLASEQPYNNCKYKDALSGALAIGLSSLFSATVRDALGNRNLNNFKAAASPLDSLLLSFRRSAALIKPSRRAQANETGGRFRLIDATEKFRQGFVSLASCRRRRRMPAAVSMGHGRRRNVFLDGRRAHLAVESGFFLETGRILEASEMIVRSTRVGDPRENAY